MPSSRERESARGLRSKERKATTTCRSKILTPLSREVNMSAKSVAAVLNHSHNVGTPKLVLLGIAWHEEETGGGAYLRHRHNHPYKKPFVNLS